MFALLPLMLLSALVEGQFPRRDSFTNGLMARAPKKDKFACTSDKYCQTLNPQRSCPFEFDHSKKDNYHDLVVQYGVGFCGTDHKCSCHMAGASPENLLIACDKMVHFKGQNKDQTVIDGCVIDGVFDCDTVSPDSEPCPKVTLTPGETFTKGKTACPGAQSKIPPGYKGPCPSSSS